MSCKLFHLLKLDSYFRQAALVVCQGNFAWWQAEGQRCGGAEGKELVQISPLLPCSSADLHPAILGWRTTSFCSPVPCSLLTRRAPDNE
ncbi:hypothetical protein [Nostoc sp.]|uniref:hypothetical protein n=1 Tax=Nostoc sp. TaxID=1180 RepID=UPI002FF8DF32